MAGRIARWLIGGAVVAVVATGCAQSPNNYAVVNGEAISANHVTSLTDQINDELRAPTPISVADIGNIEVLRLIAEDVADGEDLSVTPAELSKYVTEQGGDQLASAGPSAKQYAENVAYIGVVHDAVGQDEFQQALIEADVVVNPRYGTWSPESLIVEHSGGLSEPAPPIMRQPNR